MSNKTTVTPDEARAKMIRHAEKAAFRASVGEPDHAKGHSYAAQAWAAVFAALTNEADR